MLHRKLCALSVDLDGIDEYRGLHGVAARERGTHAVMDVALPRALSFVLAQRVPLTLFVVGRDLERERSAEAIRAASAAGACVENHSWSHRYDLSRLSRPQIEEEVWRCADRIALVTDRRPRGFRAPGYVLSEALLAVLREADVAFDASSFPCPAYYAAKLVAMAGIRLRGRSTRAILDAPATQLAPRQPHERGGLFEIPMAVTRRLRLPVIGTSLALAGERGAARLVRGCLGDNVISLELHGIDFLDARDDLDDLAPHQWDVRLSVEKKLAAFGAALESIRAAGYAFVALEDVVHAS